ncbi:DUF4296 domain-containing protein [Gracilimonas sp.]|uniref:DUF4296 domain-containing protein n=1 Tax=Gracilimonas sp. TaxID=1974203 RepID=UPI0028716859|nr:DUF4296 domain-containing protein [Gracilimonas sp.]
MSGLVVIVLVTACKYNNTQPKPDDLIGEDTYIDLMVEMQHITTFKNAEPDSVNADSLKNLVYEQYGVTDEQYLRSHQYYQSQLQDQIARIDSVILRLENEQQMMQSYIDSLRQGNRAENDSTRMLEPDFNNTQLQ